MRVHHRVAIAVVVVLVISGAAIFAAHAAGLNTPTPSQTAQNAQEAPSTTTPALDTTSTTFETYTAWQARLAAEEADRQAAVAALNAAQAQELANQLQAAVNRSLKAVAPPQGPQTASPAPCAAPNLPLAWIAWCESGCNPTAHNSSSSAAGKYQYLFTTWNDFGGYASADVAPEYVQDQRAAQDTAGGSYSPWNASRSCWGGKF